MDAKPTNTEIKLDADTALTENPIKQPKYSSKPITQLCITQLKCYHGIMLYSVKTKKEEEEEEGEKRKKRLIIRIIA